jgi:hypothetical protein
VAGHWQPVYGYEYPNHSQAEYDAAMQCVDLAFVFGMRTTAAGVITPNEYVQQFCAETATNTVGFMALDPSDDVLDQLRDGVQRGLGGVKLYPVQALFDPTDER